MLISWIPASKNFRNEKWPLTVKGGACIVTDCGQSQCLFWANGEALTSILLTSYSLLIFIKPVKHPIEQTYVILWMTSHFCLGSSRGMQIFFHCINYILLHEKEHFFETFLWNFVVNSLCYAWFHSISCPRLDQLIYLFIFSHIRISDVCKSHKISTFVAVYK